MAIESDLVAFIGAMDRRIAFLTDQINNAQTDPYDRTIMSIERQQYQQNRDAQQRKLFRMRGSKRYVLRNENGDYYSFENGKYSWSADLLDALSLDLTQMENIAVNHFGSNFSERYKIIEHY